LIVAVFGTGALGSYVAARLSALGDSAVTIVGTWREGLDAIARDGIHVEEPGRSLLARPAVAHLHDRVPPAHFVLILVKSHQTASVAAAATRAVQADGRIVTLQNGLGNRDILEAAGEPQGVRVRAGLVVAGVRLIAPGQVSALPGTITLEGAREAPMQRLEGLLRAAGLATRLVDDIEPELWRKLAVNCAINPLSALRGVPNGALLEDPQTRALMAAAAEEVEAVAAARGVAVSGAARAAADIAAGTAGNRSSMLQDLDRGARTEIDALCGAVVREARRLGVPAPVNERLWREVRAREAARLATA
jgi:2-dehydropantoate 2-reductase